MDNSIVRRFQPGFHWDSVDVLAYKAEGSAPFKDVTRQVLFGDAGQASQLRYFEVQPGGYTTLERHEHVHAVMVIRGHGRCLVGTEVHKIGTHDLITVPPLTWHQFKSEGTEPLGFLCMVDVTRDRPQLPNEQDVQNLRKLAHVAAFIAT
jgi:mannose-6-phosphate isomerase-like protein (cupin superfamily)